MLKAIGQINNTSTLHCEGALELRLHHGLGYQDLGFRIEGLGVRIHGFELDFRVRGCKGPIKKCSIFFLTPVHFVFAVGQELQH